MPENKTSNAEEDNFAAEEREWIRKTKEGDPSAFSHIVRLHQARLRAFTARYVYSCDDVYDIVQEAFLNAFQHIDRFDIDRDFGRWLRGICRNRILKYFREQKTRSKRLDVITEVIENRLSEAEFLEKDDSLERIETIKSCIGTLSDSHRKLIDMRYYGNMAVKQIGTSVGKKASAVSVQLMRIRGAIKKCYEKKIKIAVP